MSYNHGGAAGGGYRGPRRPPTQMQDEHGRRNRDMQPPPESPAEKIKKQIIRVGDGLDFDAIHDLPRLVKYIEYHFNSCTGAILEGFRTGITEQPYKMPYYATLVSLLSNPPMEHAAEGGEPEDSDAEGKKKSIIGRLVLEDLIKAFRSWVDERKWRETRLMIHLFAHLTIVSVVSPASFLALLQSFLAVVDELGVSPARAEKAIICVGEGIIRGGDQLRKRDPEALDALLAAIEVYVMTRQSRRDVVSPFGGKISDTEELPEEDDILIHLHLALRELASNEFTTPKFLPKPHLLFASPTSPESQELYDLPLVMVPPEVVEASEKHGTSETRTEGWATCEMELFEDDIVPSPSTPAGWILRQLTHDTISIFEINRKECARLLLEFPNWFESGTFKPPPNVQLPPPSDPDAPLPTWSLESLIVSSILSTIVLLPTPQYKTIYYTSLLTELCKLSPSTVAPPVGKCARRLYAALDQGMDVECVRRTADWLSLHLSNFSFQWLWKDWVPDLDLPRLHPKLAFIRRVVELEIRLSYHDRVKGTLPEAMRDPAAGIMAEDAEAPYYPFEDAANEHHETAATLQTLFRSKADPESVLNSLAGFPLQPAGQPLTYLTRAIATQTLLFIGARSFSHFLNATERYLPLLRGIATNSTERMDILRNVGSFWRESGQMRVIIGDKLMQYGIVGGEDVVRWVFEEQEEEMLGSGVGGRGEEREKTAEQWMAGQKWDVLRMGVDKVNGRVVGVRRKIVALEAEEEEKKGGRRAATMVDEGEGDDGKREGMDVDAETNEAPSNSLTSALSALSSLQQTQKSVLVLAVQNFVESLLPTLSSSSTPHGAKTGIPGLLEKGGWEARDGWDAEDWLVWSLWGWWREFCRLYLHHLRTYTSTIDTVVFSSLNKPAEGSHDEKALKLVRGVWDGVLDVAGMSS